MGPSSGSGVPVVPSGDDFQQAGGGCPMDPGLFPGPSSGAGEKGDIVEAALREEMSQMLTSASVTGTAQPSKPAARHCKSTDWIMGVPGLYQCLHTDGGAS